MRFVFIFILSIFSIYNGLAQSRTENLILQLSQEKFKYFNKVDAQKLKALLDDRLIFVHSNGMTETKEEMIKNLENDKWSVDKVMVKEANVRVFKNDVAILIGKGKFTVNTSSGKNDMELYYTEVWVHYKKSWLLSSRHANRIN
jgi:hypothetical protein